MSNIRAATPEDTEEIAELLTTCFDSRLLPYTILGCPGIAAYLYDAIRTQTMQNQSSFVVSEDGNHLIGVAEWRQYVSTLFLNHIYVRHDHRGQGIGRRLFKEGIERCRTLMQPVCELDVFSDNHPALKWYESLSLSLISQQTWYEISLEEKPKAARSWWSTSNMGQADRTHAIYGFSQFSLQTEKQNYDIGRLGKSLFRVVGASILNDPTSLQALYEIDRERELLCIGEASEKTLRSINVYRILTHSQRRTGSVDVILAHLDKLRPPNEE